jgi:type I restriction enzyme S subunit
MNRIKVKKVPNLRFEKFKNDAEWIEKKFEDIAPLQRGFDLPSEQIKHGNIPVVYSNGIQNLHYIGMAKAPGLVTGRSGTIGKIHFIENGEYWPHNTTLWVTDFKNNYPKFIFYLYSYIGLSRFASGSGVPTLNRNDVHSFKVLVPLSIMEQQKIADCLSSLDDLITAESRKLELLKTHKKGLMQQLFPAEGEKEPKLRFREFRDAWHKNNLKSVLIESRLGGNYESSESYGGIPLIKMGNIDRGSINTEKIQYLPNGINIIEEDILHEGDILFNTRNTLDLVGKVSIWKNELPRAVYNSNLLRLKFNSDIESSNRFINYFFNTDTTINRLRKFATGTTSVSAIYDKDLKNLNLMIPSIKEQQKIADCLSFLDELISAQSRKIDTLKTHKKGLMQQLFPNISAQ